MTDSAPDVDEERGLGLGIVTEHFLNREDVEPGRLTLSLRRHPLNKRCEVEWVIKDLDERGQVDVMCTLKGGVDGVRRVLIFGIDEELRQLLEAEHDGLEAYQKSTTVLAEARLSVRRYSLVVDTRFQSGKDQGFSDVGSGAFIVGHLLDHAPRG